AFSNLLVAGEALATISRDPSHAEKYKELRKQQLAAGNSALLHEFYFRNLGPVPVRPSRYLRDNMTEHMGSLEGWRDDFIACARVADSWAVLSYDPYDDRWHNAPLDRADAGGWVGGNPLVVCDVAEDAWSIDYKDREAYVTRFCEHIDWNVVASRYRKVDRH
ncbi:MAG: Fe-Mn family superoxide dismutase, partial [Candidatus Binataceae bacterium]